MKALALIFTFFSLSAFADQTVVPEVLQGKFSTAYWQGYSKPTLLIVSEKGLEKKSPQIQRYLDEKGRTDSFGEPRPTVLEQVVHSDDYTITLSATLKLADGQGISFEGGLQGYRWLDIELIYDRGLKTYELKTRIGGTTKLLGVPIALAWTDWETYKLDRN